MLNASHFQQRIRLGSSALIALFLGTMLTSAQNPAPNPAQQWWKHIEYLASDELAGRETGSEGHRRAAQYVAGAFERAGLKPAGTRGYFQPVKFISRKIVEERSSLSIVRNGKAEPVVLGEEATLAMGIEQAPRT